MRFLSALMPREARFFALFNQHAELIVAGGRATVELVRDPDTLDTFTDEECAWLLKGQISHRLFELGLMCRSDDRADPVVMLSPPLIAGDQEFDLIESVLRTVLTEAWEQVEARG